MTIELLKITLIVYTTMTIVFCFGFYNAGYKKGFKDGVNITNRIRDIDDKTKSEVENGND